MNEKRPKLMTFASDGQACKPEDLEGQPITILGDLEVETRDQRVSRQWVVRTNDGETRIYWAAGKGPREAVKYWFLENPRTPLRCMLTRSLDQWGNNVWHIEQLEDGESGGDATSGRRTIDDQLAEVGL